jgi:sialic acid synthase SpsE/spore coat polysaccharide biosynthesis protein SpsF (cytidylyltransferase family)
MELAKRMVAEAAAAGADIVKFQSYLASEVADNDPEKEWFKKVQLSDEAHYELKEYAEKQGVEFLSSPFGINRAELLCEGLGLRKIKIASSEMLNFHLLDYVNEHAETVYLSTGMATLEEIEEALQHLNKVETCYIMHCVTQYPTKPEDANLRAIVTLKTAFPEYHIGYSDHTIGDQAALTAVALGAEMIEKHFTLDKNLPGTDHILSADPNELRALVKNIEKVEILLGSYIKKPTEEEKKIKSFVRSRFRNKMRVVGIIQARMGSARLPGKTMMDIEGKPMLEHLMGRVKRSETLDSIVVATTDKAEDDVIVDLAERCGVNWFRWSEEDVLDRYIKAAEKFNVDIVVRICADSPLTDPFEIDKLVRQHVKTNADYSYNNLPHPKGLPEGAGAEAISIDVLKKIHKLATEQPHREHVTLFILDNPSFFHIERLDADLELRRPEFRLDVDYKEDLEFIREIYKRLYKPEEIIKLKDMIDLLDKHPEMHDMRRKR